MNGSLSFADVSDAMQNPIWIFVGFSAVFLIFLAMIALWNAKFLRFIFHNIRRNFLRTVLTVGSTSICLFLMMILLAFIAVQKETIKSVSPYNRVVVMSSQGFGQRLPIALVGEIRNTFADKGVVDTTPFCWFGGKLGEEVMPFAQFGVDADRFANVYNEMTIPEDQLKNWKNTRTGCLIGDKLAAERGFKIGDTIPLRGDLYPFDLDLTVCAIYHAPQGYSPRDCFFHWDYLEEGVKKVAPARAGNAGVVVVKCKSAQMIPELNAKIDELNRSSEYPTRSQSEEAFVSQFLEMWGDLPGIIQKIGLVVLFALFCVAGNTMAMALRERTRELSVLRALGFSKRLVFLLLLLEAILITLMGGIVGGLGAKFLFDVVDLARYSGGMLAAFFIPWATALMGVAISVWLGLFSGLIPAWRAATIPVISGLRKVV